jgi:CRP-like cAMP-binding protein
MSFFLDPVAQTTSTIMGGDSEGQPGDNAGLKAMAEASRDSAIAQSAAQVQIAQLQAATMQLGILKSSQDAQFQTLAWLTDRLDSNDTKMQIAVENAKLQFQQQSDRHIERMEGLKLDARELEIDAADRARVNGTSTDMFLS